MSVEIPARPSRPMWKGPLATVLFAGAFAGSLVFIDFRPDQLIEGWHGIVDILDRASPPSLDQDWAVIAQRVGETLAIAFAGTVIALILGVPLAILAAKNITPHSSVYAIARAIIAVTRAIPGIVWALIFVAAVGLGPFAGVLAVSVHSIGMIGRLVAEAIEDADPLPAQALTTTGASRGQVVSQAVVPTVLPGVLGIALYRLDENVRDSIILGVVGAGGLGFEIYTALNLFQYKTAATLLLITLALVLLVERTAAWVRKKVS